MAVRLTAKTWLWRDGSDEVVVVESSWSSEAVDHEAGGTDVPVDEL
jgi:hypothetical protein